MNIIKGLGYLVNHFDSNSLFPRTIMTKKLGYQKTVFSKEEALTYFMDSDHIDCRINAYPSHINYKGLQRYPPNFIFIDLDSNNFINGNELQSVLSKTLRKISDTLNGSKPTVIWTGNGYHVYQPLDSIILEQYEVFAKFQNPSKQFLRFAKIFLSSGNADTFNNPSFKSTLLRIPYSINSKCLCEIPDNGNINHLERSRVKIIQEWDGYRPSIKYLLRDFLHSLINQKIKEKNHHGYMYRDSKKSKQIIIYENDRKREIGWIEQLLNTAIVDYRKHVVSLILAPYLANIKGLPHELSLNILKGWLNNCNRVRILDFDSDYIIRTSLQSANTKKIPPMRLSTLRIKNTDLYDKLKVNQNHRC